MTEEEFEVAAHRSGLREHGRGREAARLHLVEGKTRQVAARLAGVSKQGLCNALRRMKAKKQLIEFKKGGLFFRVLPDGKVYVEGVLPADAARRLYNTVDHVK